MIQRFTWLSYTLALSVGLMPLSAEAATLKDGWLYTQDSFTDGVTGNQVGGGTFEFYGMALKADANYITIALNANLSLQGYALPEANNGSIAWGDLFFNFSGQDFETASANQELFAIRFSQYNDSGVQQLGVYNQVWAQSLSLNNSGFASLGGPTGYNATVSAAGGTPSFGDLPSDTAYFDSVNEPKNLIGFGNRIGDLDWNPDLTALDFAGLGAVGTETIAFRIARNLFPSGSFIANAFAECANDGIAMVANLPEVDPGDDGESVPEPTSGLALFGLALLGIGTKLRRRVAGS